MPQLSPKRNTSIEMDLSANGLMAVFVLIFFFALPSPNGLTILLRTFRPVRGFASLQCEGQHGQRASRGTCGEIYYQRVRVTTATTPFFPCHSAADIEFPR